MSILTNHMLMAAAGAQGGALDVADVFSTDLWTGASAAVTVTNGVNLAGSGGMVWGKRRDGSGNNWISDTVRNFGKIHTNTNQHRYEDPEVASYNSDGFTTTFEVSSDVNRAGKAYAAWTFRKAPKFFDIVTYTGDGSTYQQIPHNLRCPPGFVVIKRIDQASDWPAFVRISDTLVSGPVNLNGTGVPYFQNAAFGFGDGWNTSGAATYFTASHQSGMDSPNGNSTNAAGASYVAYLFAHDPSPEGLIQCGSYTGTQASGNQITLGWQPQFLLLKGTTISTNWEIWDASRDASGNNADSSLYPNTDQSEQSLNTVISPNAAGFALGAAGQNFNGQTYIYMAVRSEGV